MPFYSLIPPSQSYPAKRSWKATFFAQTIQAMAPAGRVVGYRNFNSQNVGTIADDTVDNIPGSPQILGIEVDNLAAPTKTRIYFPNTGVTGWSQVKINGMTLNQVDATVAAYSAWARWEWIAQAYPLVASSTHEIEFIV